MKAFLTGVVLAVVVSYLAPEIGIKGGPVHSELFIKKIGVGIIFLSSGLKLDASQAKQAGLNWKAHLFCQAYTFIFTPLLIYGVVTGLQTVLADALAENAFVFDAVKTLACLPPPVSSAVILVAIAQGDEAVAIFNSSLGSFLGIFVTPLLVSLLVIGPSTTAAEGDIAAGVVDSSVEVENSLGQEAATEISTSEMAVELSLTVLAPLLVGQLLKVTLGLPRPPSWIGNLILVLIIWASFCELWVSDITVTMAGLGFIVACVVGMLVTNLSIVHFLTHKVFGFDDETCTALLFASTQKSLTLGMPLIDVLFPVTASAVAIPILFCHPSQILGGGFIASAIAKRSGGELPSPRSVAYQNVAEATSIEMTPYQSESSDEDSSADGDSSRPSSTNNGTGETVRFLTV